MIRRPPRSTRTDTLCPYTTLFRAVRAVDRAFGMRHHPQDVAGVVQNASDIPRRPVDRIGIAERDAALALDPVERGGIGEIIAVVVRDRDMGPLSTDERRVGKVWGGTFKSRWSAGQ